MTSNKSIIMILLFTILLLLTCNYWFSQLMAFWPNNILDWLGSLGLMGFFGIVILFIIWCFGE